MSDTDPNAGLDAAAIARKEQQAKDLALAKDAGWHDRIPFDYVKGGFAEDAEGTSHGEPKWLSDAVVYEFDEDVGDVAKPNPELEKELFQDPNTQRAGNLWQVYDYKVDVEGPERVPPVRKVNIYILL